LQQLEDNKEATEEKIKARFNEFREILKEAEKSHLDMVEALYDHKKKKLEKDKEDIEHHQEGLSSARSFASLLIEEGTESEIAVHQFYLIERIKTLTSKVQLISASFFVSLLISQNVRPISDPPSSLIFNLMNQVLKK